MFTDVETLLLENRLLKSTFKLNVTPVTQLSFSWKIQQQKSFYCTTKVCAIQVKKKIVVVVI